MKKILILTTLIMTLNSAFAGRFMDRIQEKKQEMLEKKIEKDNNNGLIGGNLISNNKLLDLQYGSSNKEKLDVYFPKNQSNGKIILMVHGGAWKIGDKRHSAVVTNKVNYLSSKGYTLALINYNFIPDVTVEDQEKEVAQALVYVQNNAKNWNASGEKVILMGHSAGAHLVSLLSTNKNLLSLAKYPILGTVSLDSAAYDIYSIMNEGKHYKFYDEAFGNNQEYWKKMSPYHNVEKNMKPMYLVCSTLRDESCLQADKFVEKMKSFNNVVYVDKENKKHAEINEELGSDMTYTRKIENFIESLN